MSNNAKFKIGDWVVRTTMLDRFPSGKSPVVVIGFDTDGWLCFKPEDFDTGGWIPDYFELCVKPENKVPDNMEIVGYQVEMQDGWCEITEKAYHSAHEFGWNTRTLYAFRQD